MKHKGKIVVGIVIVLAAATALVVGKQVLGGSATGTITTAAPRAAKKTTAVTTSVAETGQYAAFTYPSSFTAVKSDSAVYPVLVNYNFIKEQLGSWQMAIQISDLPTGNISDNGSYNYRKVTTAQYAFTSQKVNGQSIPVATDKMNGAFNEVAYLTHGTKVATISLMGGNGQDNDKLQAALTSVLTSWQWQ